MVVTRVFFSICPLDCRVSPGGMGRYVSEGTNGKSSELSVISCPVGLIGGLIGFAVWVFATVASGLGRDSRGTVDGRRGESTSFWGVLYLLPRLVGELVVLGSVAPVP